eukprot:CAMPEP_0119048110 /NCGR_PEP_ID=MMETSP1177-20130426/56965_1 /TAXON_ID=2985 /ORGANISM="Ochromonas sp, Strain CCMP1899" /LENGTH=56 /DNA_ID=CAMNT_0007023545 /DNA_START=44 /DNA_END=210 /DNA_ORIENTATION=+
MPPSFGSTTVAVEERLALIKGLARRHEVLTSLINGFVSAKKLKDKPTDKGKKGKGS